MVYDYLDEDPLVTTSQRLQLANSTVVQPYKIAENVLIEFQDPSTLVDFMVVDMDPHQQTSIFLWKPFLKSVRITIDKRRGTINMKVDRVHEKFIYHPMNLACYYQIRVHRYLGPRKVRCVEVILEQIRSHPQP
jgi:carotenoid cleavage dioxygenase-like enzyme